MKCPECRKETTREGCEPVHFTAQKQWDTLLEIAQDWLKIDKHAAEDATEDEDEEEEPFIEEDMEPPTRRVPQRVSLVMLALALLTLELLVPNLTKRLGNKMGTALPVLNSTEKAVPRCPT